MALSELPLELNYFALNKIHPYFLVNGYCDVSKFTKQECEDRKYEFLQVWVHPQWTIDKIRKFYPDIKLQYVIELCMIYNPIVEIFKPGTLDLTILTPCGIEFIFMNACRVRNFDVVKYYLDMVITLFQRYNYTYNEAIYTGIQIVCFYYSYPDPLEYLISIFPLQFDEQLREVMQSEVEMIELRLNPNKQFRKFDGIPISIFKPILWDLEVFAEYIVVNSLVLGDNTFFDKLVGNTRPVEGNDDDYVFVIAAMLGKDKLTNIVRRYIPDQQIRLYPEYTYTGQDASIYEIYPWMNFGKLLKQPELAPKYITEKNLLPNTYPTVDLTIYYLLSGHYDYYYSTISKGNSIILQTGTYFASYNLLNVVQPLTVSDGENQYLIYTSEESLIRKLVD